MNAAAEPPRARPRNCRGESDRLHAGMLAAAAELLDCSERAEAMRILAGCLATGRCTSTDPAADAVTLWLGLHGLAHQRAIAPAFPWPADIVQLVPLPLSHPVRALTTETCAT